MVCEPEGCVPRWSCKELKKQQMVCRAVRFPYITAKKPIATKARDATHGIAPA